MSLPRVGLLLAVAAAFVVGLLGAAAPAGVNQVAQAPQMERIFATHPTQGEGFVTRYEVVGNVGPGSWEFTWSKTHPPGSVCGIFSSSGRAATWEHHHPPCPEQHPHPGHIHVKFTNGTYDCTGLYEFGSAAGSGREPPKCVDTPFSFELFPMSAADKRYYKRWAFAYERLTYIYGMLAGISGPGAPAFLALSVLSGGAYLAFAKLADDPPDANFTVLVKPSVRPVPMVRSGRRVPANVATAVNGLTAQTARLEAVLRAFLTSYERAQGATQARNSLWAPRQQQAAARHALEAAKLLDTLAAHRARARRAFEAAGVPFSVTASQLGAAQQGVARRGLPPALKSGLRRMGFTAAAIRGLEAGTARFRVRAGSAALMADPALVAADRAAARALRRYAQGASRA